MTQITRLSLDTLSKSTMAQSSAHAASKRSSLTNYPTMLAISLVIGICMAIGLTRWTEHQHYQSLERQGNERLDLYASTVQAAKQRYDYLPYIASQDQAVKSLLQGSAISEPVSEKLRSWQHESGAAVLYLMDSKGEVVASSNWQDAESFVGNNYHFRPYFQDAIEGKRGLFFAIGVSTGRPGLFLSRPIISEGRTVGAAVVKIDMTQLEADWARGGEFVLITDTDGVVFLSSNPDWKYKSLSLLDSDTVERMKEAKKYANNTIAPLPILNQEMSDNGHPIIELSGESEHSRDRFNYLMHSRPIEELNWTLHYLSDLKPLIAKQRYSLIIATLFTVLIALLGFIFVNRIESRRVLEERVEKRTRDLNKINTKLLDEIDTRIQTEEQLRQTHEELIQAEKLAALGQMSAGIVHEINQPLSAMQTFVASTRLLLDRDDRESAKENLEDVSSMIRRVTTIISHLKNFASKSRGHTSPVEVNQVIKNALLLLNTRLDKSDIKLTIEYSPVPVYVIADEIKLEQILINLIRNALDAMQSIETPEIQQLKIWMTQDNGRTAIHILDTGPGINADDLPKVFDPFFTTKPPGEGLGLGLSVSYGIAKEFGGDLEVMDNPETGTIFKLSLDTASENGAEQNG